jgi:hypothetical protein
MMGRSPAADLLAPLGARRRLSNGTQTAYGLGLARSPLPGEIAVGHGGSLPGYKNHFLLLPERQAGVVVVSNREDTDAHGIALRVLAALCGVDLQRPARNALPEGIFVADKGPFWIEHARSELTFLGATGQLFEDEDGAVVGRSADLPMRLRRTEDRISGDIGHVAHDFAPVAPGIVLGRSWEGEWVNERHSARCTIEKAEGGARFSIAAGPLRTTVPLMPLDPYRTLTDRREGPWRQRACLLLNPRAHTLRLVTNRSRVLQFRKA